MFGSIWSPFHQEPNDRNIILIYHSIDGGPLSISREKFHEQIAWLAEHTDVVSLDEIINGSNPGADSRRKRVVLTFDDGYKSLFDTVAPILSEYEVVATVYLNTGWIGEAKRKSSDATLGHYEEEQFLVWREVELLRQAGWTIGSHGVNHLDLTTQNKKVVQEELVNSKLDIEVRLGQACQHFAYTWGRFTPFLQRAVKAAGYTSAVSGLHGPVQTRSNHFSLPRIDIRAGYEQRDFEDAVTGRWDYLGLKQRLARRLA